MNSPRPVSPEILAAALAESSEGVIVTNAGQDIVFANQAVQDLTGYSMEEMLGRNCRFLQGTRSDPATVADIRRMLAGGNTFRGLILNYRKDGREFWNDLTVSPMRDQSGDITHFVSVQRDSSELVALREDLRVQLDRVKDEAETAQLLLRVGRLLSTYSSVNDVTDAIADGVRDICGADRSVVTSWDASSGILNVSAQSGWPPHLTDKLGAISVPMSDFPELLALTSSARPVSVGPGASPLLRQFLDGFEVSSFLAMPITSHGAVRGMLLACWATGAPSSAGNLLEERLEGLSHLAAVALDNTSLLEQAVWNGTHDALTGLPDRTLFEQSLRRALEADATSSQTVAVLFMDVDRFKGINDALGHTVGDGVLRHVGAVLRTATRESDFIARVGGDEFVVVIAHPHARDTAERVADRIRTALRTPLEIGRQKVRVSISVGIATSSDLLPGLSLAEQTEMLTTSADAAMYRAKAARSEVTDGRRPSGARSS